MECSKEHDHSTVCAPTFPQDVSSTVPDAPQSKPRRRRHSPRRTFRQRYGAHWLRTLFQTLPPDTFRRCVRHFLGGGTAQQAVDIVFAPGHSVTRHRYARNTIRIYLQVLRKQVIKLDKQRAQRITRREQAARAIREEEIQAANAITVQQAVEEARAPETAAPPRPSAPEPLVREVRDISRELERMIVCQDANELALFVFAQNLARFTLARKMEDNIGIPIPIADAIYRTMLQAVQTMKKPDLGGGRSSRANQDVEKSNREEMTTADAEFIEDARALPPSSQMITNEVIQSAMQLARLTQKLQSRGIDPTQHSTMPVSKANPTET